MARKKSKYKRARFMPPSVAAGLILLFMQQQAGLTGTAWLAVGPVLLCAVLSLYWLWADYVYPWPPR